MGWMLEAMSTAYGMFAGGDEYSICDGCQR